MKARAPADAATRARLRAVAEQALALDEWRARLSIPLSADERARTRELIAWFRRRYPTPAERLAYVRRAYARWVPPTTP